MEIITGATQIVSAVCFVLITSTIINVGNRINKMEVQKVSPEDKDK